MKGICGRDCKTLQKFTGSTLLFVIQATWHSYSHGQCNHIDANVQYDGVVTVEIEIGASLMVSTADQVINLQIIQSGISTARSFSA